MIQKIINRLSLTIQQLSGDKTFTIKLANACVELLRNHAIKKHIKKTTNISRIKEVFIENGNTLIQLIQKMNFLNLSGLCGGKEKRMLLS